MTLETTLSLVLVAAVCADVSISPIPHEQSPASIPAATPLRDAINAVLSHAVIEDSGQRFAKSPKEASADVSEQGNQAASGKANEDTERLL